MGMCFKPGGNPPTSIAGFRIQPNPLKKLSMKVITYMQGVLNETNEDSANRLQLVVLVVGQPQNSNQHWRKLPLNLGNVHQSMLLSLLPSLQVWHRILEETVASAHSLGLLE